MKKFIPVLLILIVIIVAVVFTFKMLLKPSPSGASPQSQERSPKDINWDNKVDDLDANIIKSVLGCKKTDPCWNKVVGKTITGDNPIYASDADLNKDGVIDQKDIDFLKAN